MKQVCVVAAVLCAVSGAAFGQKTPPDTKPKVHTPTPPRPAALPREYQGTSERSIEVDPNVSIKLCVSEGRVKVNGWERGEVRLFVHSGRLPGFKVLEKDHSSGKPNWILIANKRPEGTPPGPMSECLSGDQIELDVPVKSSLSLTGRAADTTVDTVRKISIKLVEGDIALRNIGGGISAATYQGDLTVESSGGAISLESTTGDILAFDVNPGQIGDVFRAKASSGALSLQRVEHRQIEASTISGAIVFYGKFLDGGLYNFKTSNGPIRLNIPVKSSFTMKASYGFGTFNTDLPLKFIYQKDSPAGKNFLAMLGTGDSDINLTTNRGNIHLRKQ